MSELSNRLRGHRGLWAILLLHAVVFWAVVGTASPWTTAPLECAPGGAAELLLKGSSWSVWDSFHGGMAGSLLAALAGLPLFATVGATGFAIKAVAWVGALALLVVVYALLDRHESRPAALLACAGLAFAPPALFHPSAVLGNWHWTQLIFDYGLVLFALELLRVDRGKLAWALFGLLSGLAIFNCIASLPFVAVAWGLLLLGAGGRATVRRFGLAALTALVGLAPYLYKLLFHRPFGLPEVVADQTVTRLMRVGFEPALLFDFLHPELPWALHVHDAIDWLPTWAGLRMGTLWTAVVWVGMAACATLAARAWLGAGGTRRRPPLAVVPPLFALLFALAYICLDTHLEMLPAWFTNAREPGHRMLPPMLAALVVGSAIGWSRLTQRLPQARPALFAAALIPVAVGLASQVSLVQPAAPAGVAAYRGSCGDALGFNAAASFRGDSAGAQRICRGLGDDATEEDCRSGAAWGAGFYGGRVGNLTPEQAPADWDRSELALLPEAQALCDELVGERRDQCLFGLGWYVGSLGWGRDHWPLAACDSLPVADRARCWRGVGFPVGDHLHPSPWKVGAVVRLAPPEHRREVAWGAGVAIGRTWSSPEYGRWLCREAELEEVDACEAGVDSRH